MSARLPKHSMGKPVFVVTAPQFGARADGTADDAPALQRAIDAAAAAGGGNVMLPSGTYRLAGGHLQFSSDERGAQHVALVGSRTGASRIVLGDHFGACIYDSSPGLRDLWIQDIAFDASGLDRMCCVVLSRSLLRVSFVRCSFANVKDHYAVTVGNVSDRASGEAGEDINFVDCTFSALDCGTYEALLYQNARRGAIRGCRFTGYEGSACALGLYGYVEDTEVHDNSFEGAVRGGDIYTQQCARISIRRNRHVAGAPSAASIEVKNSVDIRIEENDIVGATVAGRGASDGVQIFDFDGTLFDGVHPSKYPDSTRITMRANRVRSTFHGFSVPSHERSAQQRRAQSQILIDGNTFAAQYSSPILIGAASTQDIRNVVLSRNIIESPPAQLRGEAGLIDVACNRGFVGSSLAVAVSAAPQPQTISLSSSPDIVPGQAVDVGMGDERETIEPTQTEPGSITAIFVKDHAAGSPCAPSLRIVGKGIADISIVGNVIKSSSTGAGDVPAIHIDGASGVRITDNDLRGTSRGIVASDDAEILEDARNRTNGPELIRSTPPTP